MNGYDVVAQMVAAGLEPPDLPLDTTGRLRRFGPKKRCWYSLRETRTASGRVVVVGSFGDWRVGKWKVDVDWRGLAEEERAQLKARREAARQAERERRAFEAAQAAMSAAELWAAASRTGSSEYLRRKAVEPEACRFLGDGSIVVPLLRYDEPRETALKALQRIWPDGTKRFTKGFQKAGVCCRLGLVAAGEPVLVCEGYATGLSLRMAVERRLPVFVALDAGNLQPVVELLRRMYRGSRILVCADDDWRTPGNPGRQHAYRAARAVDGASYTWPYFRPACRGPKDTDFNDLHVREGLGAVRRQLAHVLPLLGAESLDAAA